MTLHADFHLPLRTKAGWIHDRAPDEVGRQSPPNRAHVLAPKPMASLAINALWQAFGKQGCPVPEVGSGLDPRVPVMAKEAAISHVAAEAEMIRAIIGRTHAPMSALFRVP